MSVPCCGVISQWIYVQSGTGELTAQIWEPVSGNNFKVLSQNAVPGGPAGNIRSYDVPTADQISVEQGQLLGW